jgi:hypothetical protein
MAKARRSAPNGPNDVCEGSEIGDDDRAERTQPAERGHRAERTQRPRADRSAPSEANRLRMRSRSSRPTEPNLRARRPGRRPNERSHRVTTIGLVRFRLERWSEIAPTEPNSPAHRPAPNEPKCVSQTSSGVRPRRRWMTITIRRGLDPLSVSHTEKSLVGISHEVYAKRTQPARSSSPDRHAHGAPSGSPQSG